MSARCPEGHLSHDPDYCDHCGIRIVAGQDSYGYRPDEPAGRGAAPRTQCAANAGCARAARADGYGPRRYGD
nr:hypothetical protein [Micromonospora sp. DSM 115978]